MRQSLRARSRLREIAIADERLWLDCRLSVLVLQSIYFKMTARFRPVGLIEV
jgi:hypothetical protein